ncbi:2-oxoacid:acceptor oxidoreductase subunit alpha, partial [Candidatus Beckwithbacteria bacterium]|nr:2-oxoacid:acceptor oxidoreductase subunit alpha [Candidatus Beckwithbacteria bacterium]
TEYPSLVRGGHNVMQVSISPEKVTSAFQPTNLLVALNQDTIDFHFEELTDDAILLFDKDKNLDTSKVKSSVKLCPVPLSQIVKDLGGPEIMSNTVALGASLALMGGDLKHLKDLITEEFGHKKAEVIELNHKGVEQGYDYAAKEYKNCCGKVLEPRASQEKLMVVNGNQTAAFGAIAAGLQFAAIYPMTPTSNILHTLAPLQEKYDFIYKQPEDEIAAINMALGAAHAGARSMVATSGGGFCLMSETYGLAGLSETPVVIVEGMRGAPATGIPTWTEQGDLKMVVSAHQGDFPRIVLAAGDGQETFELTMKAFNLADKYQTPVILIIDKHICENDESYPAFDYSSWQLDRGKFTREKMENFKRFALSDDGISLRSAAGTGNYYLANSDEHDEIGYSNEEIDNRNAQMKKRMTKLQTCIKEDMEEPKLYGPQEADITLVSWGSNKGAILETLKDFPNVNFLHLTWVSPFPTEAVKRHLDKAKYVINIECNYSAQMASIIREKTGIEILDHLLKYDGRPIYPEEIAAKITSVLKK